MIIQTPESTVAVAAVTVTAAGPRLLMITELRNRIANLNGALVIARFLLVTGIRPVGRKAHTT
jgi:hypothetical protein